MEKITWVGSSVGDYDIDLELCEGPFSTVYRGTVGGAGEPVVIKAAKIDGMIGANELGTGCFATEARVTRIGGTEAVYPAAQQVLQQQFEKLRVNSCPQLVSVDKFIKTDLICYYTMEYLEGITFRDMLTLGQVTISQLISVLKSVDDLSRQDGWDYHGDLKPENIIICRRGAVLIDPGYFGPIESEGFEYRDAAITTPSYYPCLDPDDLLALGVTIWEAIVGSHPLRKVPEELRRDRRLMGNALRELVEDQETVGKYFLTPLLDVPFPRSLKPGISEEGENFLLRLLRLRKGAEAGVLLDLDPGFSSAAEILEGLRSLSDIPEHF